MVESGRIDHTGIVVLGAMNPSIHHPRWYKDVDLMSESEVQQSFENDYTFVPQISSFETNDFRVLCDLNRWELRSDGDHKRAITTASEVFRRLEETPVSAFGLNFARHCELDVRVDAGDLLARVMFDIPLGFNYRPEDEPKATFKAAYTAQDRRVTVTVERSRHGGKQVYVGLNFHYDIHSQGFERFDLDRLIAERAEADVADAVAQFERTAARLTDAARR